jgi:predicted N-acetyltransferase YhbS
MGVRLPEGFRLRMAERGEAQLLLDIMLACWTGTVPPNSTAYRETADMIAIQLEQGGAAIVMEGVEPVGAGRFMPVPGSPDDAREWVELKRIGVLKSRRKLGLGSPLVLALEAEAQRRGHPGSQIGIRHDQPGLVGFWSGLGYTRARDVQLHTVNPLTPPPVTMRKVFG